jgi:hypothetical protein
MFVAALVLAVSGAVGAGLANGQAGSGRACTSTS